MSRTATARGIFSSLNLSINEMYPSAVYGSGHPRTQLVLAIGGTDPQYLDHQFPNVHLGKTGDEPETA